MSTLIPDGTRREAELADAGKSAPLNISLPVISVYTESIGGWTELNLVQKFPDSSAREQFLESLSTLATAVQEEWNAHRGKLSKITHPALLGEAKVLQDRILKMVGLHQITDKENFLFNLKMALEESFTNHLFHGNRCDPRKKLHVEWQVIAPKDQLERVVVFFRDEGKGFDPDKVPDPTTEENLDIAHGRGLLLIRAYSSQLQLLENGRASLLIFDLQKQDAVL